MPRVQTKPGGGYITFSFVPAVEIVEAGGPDTYVAVRLWPDDGIHDAMSPRDWLYMVIYEAIDQLGQEVWEKYKSRIFVVAGNEPHENGYMKWADWTLELMRLAREFGLRLLVGSFGQGHPIGYKGTGPEPIIQQIIDLFGEILRELQDGFHWLSLHEYHDIGWGDPRTFPPPWYLWGRFLFWIEACRRLGLAFPRIFITEFGFDSTDNGWAKGYRAVARNTKYTIADLIVMVLYVIANIYGPWIKRGVIMALAWFGYGKDWSDFSIEGDTESIEALNDTVSLYSGDEEVPTMEWKTGRIFRAGNINTNVRKEPSIYADVVGSITDQGHRASWDGDDDNMVHRVEQKSGQSYDLYWRQVVLEDGDIHSWVADIHVLYVLDVPAPDPDPDPDPGPAPVDVAALAAAVAHQWQQHPELIPVDALAAAVLSQVNIQPDQLDIDWNALSRQLLDRLLQQPGFAALHAAVLRQFATMAVEIADSIESTPLPVGNAA